MKLKNKVLVLLLMLSLLFPTLLPGVTFADEGSYTSTPSCISSSAQVMGIDNKTWVDNNQNLFYLAGLHDVEFQAASIGGVDNVSVENYPLDTPISLDGTSLGSDPANYWTVFSFPLNQIVLLGSGEHDILRYFNDGQTSVTSYGLLTITVPTESSVFLERIWDGGPMDKDIEFQLARKTILDGSMTWVPFEGSEIIFLPSDIAYEWTGLPFANAQGYVYTYFVDVSGTAPGYKSFSFYWEEISDCYFEEQIVVHYEASGSFTPEVTKVFVDGDLSKRTFLFTLYKQVSENAWNVVESAQSQADGTIPFSPIVYDESDIGKKFSYFVEEDTIIGPSNIIFDHEMHFFDVIVSDNGDGTLKMDVDEINEMVFTNIWLLVDVNVEKIWEGAPADKPPVTIRLLQDGEPIDSVVLDGSEADPWKHTWQVPPMDIFGIPHEYSILEETQLDGYEDPVYGKLSDGALTVTNKKIPPTEIEVEILGKKELKGRELKADEFGFSIYNASDLTKPIQSVKNAKDGIFSFLIEFKEGKYELVITEDKGTLEHVTYDKTEVEVGVVVTKDANGFLVAEVTPKTDIAFKNTYAPPKLPDTGGGVGIGYLLAGLMLLGVGGVALVGGRKKREQ